MPSVALAPLRQHIWRFALGTLQLPPFLCRGFPGQGRQMPSADTVQLAHRDAAQLGFCLGAMALAGLFLQRPPSSSPAGPTGRVQPAAVGTLPGRGAWRLLGVAVCETRSQLHVVLDVDETLVRSRPLPPGFPIKSRECGGEVFGLSLPGGQTLEVSKRPGLHGFLHWLRAQDYEVSLYTAGKRMYVEALLPYLDPDGVISSYLSREDCVLAPGLPNAYLKDLRRVRSTSTAPDGGRREGPADLARTVLVDNNPLSFVLQPENGILVSDWLGIAPEDSELERVKELLLELESRADRGDVREVLPSLQKPNVRGLVQELRLRLRRSSL